MLISLGLWKSRSKATKIDEDGIYPISPTQLADVKSGKGFKIGQLFARKHEE